MDGDTIRDGHLIMLIRRANLDSLRNREASTVAGNLRNAGGRMEDIGIQLGIGGVAGALGPYPVKDLFLLPPHAIGNANKFRPSTTTWDLAHTPGEDAGGAWGHQWKIVTGRRWECCPDWALCRPFLWSTGGSSRMPGGLDQW